MITKIELAARDAAPRRRGYGDRGAGCGIRIAIHPGSAEHWQNVVRSRTRCSVKCSPYSSQSRARPPTRARAGLPAHRPPRRSEPSKARENISNEPSQSPQTESVVFGFARSRCRGLIPLQCPGVLAFQALEELHGGILFLSWTGSGAVCSFVWELVSEHRKPAFRAGSRGFVLNDVPMLSEDTVLQAHHVHHDPTRRSCAETRKTTMQHQEISVR